MNALLDSVSAVMLILLMAAVGYFCGRVGWMRHEHKAFLVKFIMNLAMPCMCVNSVMGSVSHELLASAGPLLLVPLCAILALTLLAILLARLLRISHARLGVFVVMCCVANSMFIGYPMCTALFGDAATPFVLCYYLINTSFFQLVGVGFLNLAGKEAGAKIPLRQTLRGIVKPPICTILACVALVLLDVRLPSLAMRFVGYMGNTVTPLALLYTGFVMYEVGFSHIRMEPSLWVMLLVRHAIAPLTCLLFCRLLGVGGLARSVLAAEMGMPVMTQVVVLSAECGADEGYAAVGTTVSTLACFVSIPLLMMIIS